MDELTFKRDTISSAETEEKKMETTVSVKTITLTTFPLFYCAALISPDLSRKSRLSVAL